MFGKIDAYEEGNRAHIRDVVFSIETLKTRVDSLKDDGNALHKKRKYVQAVSKYTEAIDAIKSLDEAAMRAEGVTTARPSRSLQVGGYGRECVTGRDLS